MLSWFSAHAGDFLTYGAYVVAGASAVAQMTPNQTDNKIVAVLSKVLNFFALNWGSDKKPSA